MVLPSKVNSIVRDILDLLKPNKVYLNSFKFYQKSILFEGGTFDIKGRVHIFSLGKAASFEALAFRSLLEGSGDVEIASCVSYTKKDHLVDDDRMYQLAGSHPLLTEENLELSKVFVDSLSHIPASDSLVFLLSGGGSALLEIPRDNMTFDDLQNKHKDLLESGQNINEMNAQRKVLSLVKNGGLLDHIKTRNILQLITCDIPNENIFDVSSGPLLKEGSDDNPLTITTQSASRLLESIAKKEGFIDKGVHDGKLEDYLQTFVNNLPVGNDIFVSGGELTINVTSDSGKGGRSTHFVLSLADEIYKDSKNHNVHILSFGTDGTDGPTDAAGAYINYSMYNGEKVKDSLSNFDSYNYFHEVGGLIKTGPTMNNLMDIRFIWREN